MINALVYDAGPGGLYLSCQFPHGPSECNPTPVKVQPSDISRGGTLYLYDRGVGFTTYRLTYGSVTEDVLGVLEQIVDQASGSTFETTDWFDHAGMSRRVRFKGPVTAKETTPGKYRVSFTLEDY
jgi:hypothetical protein